MIRGNAEATDSAAASRARRQKHSDAAFLPHHLDEKPVVEKVERILSDDFDISRASWIERVALEHGRRFEIVRVERRIDRRGQPDEPAPDALAQGKTQLELGRRLVNLIHDQRIGRENVAILKPSPSDAGGDDYDIPRRCFGSCFALAIHDADAEVVRAKDLLSNRPDGKCLSCSCACYDSEAFSGTRELPDFFSVLLLEDCFDVKVEGQLDCLARRSCGSDYDDSACRWLGRDERSVIRRKELVADLSHREGKCKKQDTGATLG